MFKVKLLAALSAATFLGACIETTPVSTTPTSVSANLQQQAVSVITRDFRDPESARVRNVRGYATQLGDSIVCGEVNGKNAFGAYVGYRDFYVRFRAGVVRSTQIDSDEYLFFATTACSQAARGTLLLPANDAPS